jgi:hypothetical protein
MSRRVVIDLRHNSGGDNTHARVRSSWRSVIPAIDRPGRFFAIIGGWTFSAAANFATDLEQDDLGHVRRRGRWAGARTCTATLGPSRCGISGQTLNMAARYWERSTPDDPRITIEPEIRADVDRTTTSPGAIPVLEAIRRGADTSD